MTNDKSFKQSVQRIGKRSLEGESVSAAVMQIRAWSVKVTRKQQNVLSCLAGTTGEIPLLELAKRQMKDTFFFPTHDTEERDWERERERESERKKEKKKNEANPLTRLIR